jgi:hypothetical protein
MGDNGVDLAVRHEYTLHTCGLRCVGRLEEHVTTTDEVFGTRRIKHRTRINLARHREGDAAWDVGLD